MTTKIKRRHCPRCNHILDAHVVHDLFGNETEYVEFCAHCQWSRRSRIKNSTPTPASR